MVVYAFFGHRACKVKASNVRERSGRGFYMLWGLSASTRNLGSGGTYLQRDFPRMCQAQNATKAWV